MEECHGSEASYDASNDISACKAWCESKVLQAAKCCRWDSKKKMCSVFTAHTTRSSTMYEIEHHYSAACKNGRYYGLVLKYAKPYKPNIIKNIH